MESLIGAAFGAAVSSAGILGVFLFLGKESFKGLMDKDIERLKSGLQIRSKNRKQCRWIFENTGLGATGFGALPPN